MKQTDNYKLNLPEDGDYFNISHINSNMTAIDAALGRANGLTAVKLTDIGIYNNELNVQKSSCTVIQTDNRVKGTVTGKFTPSKNIGANTLTVFVKSVLDNNSNTLFLDYDICDMVITADDEAYTAAALPMTTDIRFSCPVELIANKEYNFYLTLDCGYIR